MGTFVCMDYVHSTALTLQPPPNSNQVSVFIDSVDAVDLLSFSACTLYFNTSNWNIPQTIWVLPRPTSRISPGTRVRACARALLHWNYVEPRCAVQTWSILITANDYSNVVSLGGSSLDVLVNGDISVGITK